MGMGKSFSNILKRAGVESAWMHELSIVSSVVDSVTETLASYPGAQVLEVRLKVGAMAAVVVDSLEFCWGIATQDTPLVQTKLVVRTVPVVIHCVPCGRDVELEGVQSLRCPFCGEATMDVRQGRELEIESIEIEDALAEIGARADTSGANA
jgi:hydrogenase nickel incorporation protein HypA/HybF